MRISLGLAEVQFLKIADPSAMHVHSLSQAQHLKQAIALAFATDRSLSVLLCATKRRARCCIFTCTEEASHAVVRSGPRNLPAHDHASHCLRGHGGAITSFEPHPSLALALSLDARGMAVLWATDNLAIVCEIEPPAQVQCTSLCLRMQSNVSSSS